MTAWDLPFVQQATEIPKTFGGPFIFIFYLSFLFVCSVCLFICRTGSPEAQVGLELIVWVRMTMTSCPSPLYLPSAGIPSL